VRKKKPGRFGRDDKKEEEDGEERSERTVRTPVSLRWLEFGSPKYFV
jgi:hypothetical protein